MSIASAVKAYVEKKPLRFHTPGHKGALLSEDITEIDDGKLFPSDEIVRAEERIAAYYGADFAFMLTGGSSMGVKAAIMAADTDILCWTYSHKSVFDGAEIARRKAITVGSDPVRPPKPHEIEAALDLIKSIGAVVITSPTYFGFTADLKAIKEIAFSRGVKLIVDGAHGAHFKGSKLFPPPPDTFASLCNVSAHKTLDCITPGAILLGRDVTLQGGVKRGLRLLGTTSPSYPLLASIEHSVETLAASGDAYEELYSAIADFKSDVATLDNDDFSRIVVDASHYGLDGAELNSRLMNANVYSEMTYGDYVVFIATAHDKTKEISALKNAVLECVRKRV